MPRISGDNPPRGFAHYIKAMGQQYEFKLMDEPEDVVRQRRGQAFRPAQAVTTIIEVEPGAAHHPSKHPRPVKAKPAFLPHEATAEEAFRLTLTQCKWHIAANVPAVVDARDVEGMHQLRVGFRRLRVALSSFGGEFRTASIEALRGRAKKIATRLAPARDLDVFLGELFEPAASANGSADAFAVLRSRAEAARRRAWDNAVSCVISPVFSGFMVDLGDALDRQVWREGTPSGSHATKGIIAFEAPATALAHRMLDHRLAQARKRGRKLEQLSDAKRHQLRIALKKLRYTAEFFAPLYAPAAVAPFLKRMSRMQDVLGALNDVVVARTTLEWLVDIDDGGSVVSHSALSFAAGMVYGWHLECAAHTWENAVQRWKKFTKVEPFWSAGLLD